MSLTVSNECANGFWRRVSKQGPVPEHAPELGPCWIFTSRHGCELPVHKYGYFKYAGKQQPAHRVAYCIEHGAVPVGLSVLHRCNVKSCVNPSHLYAGTDLDNQRDNITHGVKRPHPTDHYLTDEEVVGARYLFAYGIERDEIARFFRCRPDSLYWALHDEKHGGPAVPPNLYEEEDRISRTSRTLREQREARARYFLDCHADRLSSLSKESA